MANDWDVVSEAPAQAGGDWAGVGESPATPPPNSILGGAGRRVVDTLKGVGDTFRVTPAQVALGGPIVPLYRMAKGAVQSGITAGKQVTQQAKTASAIPAGNPLIKTLSYARALNTGLSALS